MGNPTPGLHWYDTLGMAMHTITRNRTRSLLLILGVSIGVTTLLAIYTIVGGLSNRIRDDIVSANRPPIEAIAHFLEDEKTWILPKLFGDNTVLKVAHGLAG